MTAALVARCAPRLWAPGSGPDEPARSLKSEALLRFLVRRVLPAEPAVLAQLEALGRLLAILRRAVIPSLTFGARERDDVSHNSFQLTAASSQGSQLEAGSWELEAIQQSP